MNILDFDRPRRRRQKHVDGSRVIPARLRQQKDDAQVRAGIEKVRKGVICVRLGA